MNKIRLTIPFESGVTGLGLPWTESPCKEKSLLSSELGMPRERYTELLPPNNIEKNH